MKMLKYLTIIALVPACMLFAGEKNRAEAEAGMKHAIAKERQRAEDARQHHANTERFEQKYGWAKEKNPELYSAMMTANKKAAETWAAVARQAESATHPEALSEARQAAGVAASEAYQAELALKYAAAASERRHMAEKSGSAEVSALAGKLDANEKALFEANRAKNEAAAAAEKLQNENRTLNKSLHDAYKNARAAGRTPDEHSKKAGAEQPKKK